MGTKGCIAPQVADAMVSSDREGMVLPSTPPIVDSPAVPQSDHRPMLRPQLLAGTTCRWQQTLGRILYRMLGHSKVRCSHVCQPDCATGWAFTVGRKRTIQAISWMATSRPAR